MWNKLKGFFGFLIIAGCIMIWLSFIPIDPIKIYSGSLEQYGLQIIGFGSLAFFIVLVLHGINEHLHRFKPEPWRVVWRSKRVTRAVATIFILMLLITGLGWWLGRPYLLALGALSLDEVANNPKQYENENISVVGYYCSDMFGIFRAMGFNIDGFISPINISEIFTSLERLEDWMNYQRDVLSGQTKQLFVKLPPDTNAYTGRKYIFNGVIEMETYLGSELPILVASSIVSI